MEWSGISNEALQSFIQIILPAYGSYLFPVLYISQGLVTGKQAVCILCQSEDILNKPLGPCGHTYCSRELVAMAIVIAMHEIVSHRTGCGHGKDYCEACKQLKDAA